MPATGSDPHLASMLGGTSSEPGIARFTHDQSLVLQTRAVATSSIACVDAKQGLDDQISQLTWLTAGGHEHV